MNPTERDGFVLFPWNGETVGAGYAKRLPATARRRGRAKPAPHARFVVVFLGLSFFGGGCLGCAISLLTQV